MSICLKAWIILKCFEYLNCSYLLNSLSEFFYFIGYYISPSWIDVGFEGLDLLLWQIHHFPVMNNKDLLYLLYCPAGIFHIMTCYDFEKTIFYYDLTP